MKGGKRASKTYNCAIKERKKRKWIAMFRKGVDGSYKEPKEKAV
jgi:hypothetical protein